jgi:UDP-4-amino-4-deoxy-L-arabinose-oxoglutarate aminotransferase
VWRVLGNFHQYFYRILGVFKPDAPRGQNPFIEKMAEADIGTSLHYNPLHRMTDYRKRYNLNVDDFPNTERIWQGTVSLPIYAGLSGSDIEYVTDTISRLLA